MMALSARFSTNPTFAGTDPRERGKGFAKESNRLLDLRDVSLSTAQACVLLGAISITEGEAAAESVYYSTACRIASLLDLANKPTSDGIEREVNVRVWWSLTMIDVWSSSGVRLPRQMVHLENVPLPIDENVYLNLRRGQPVQQDHDTKSSLLAQMIQLNSILKEVNDLNECIVSGAVSGSQLEKDVLSLSQKLDNWHAALPTNMHDTQVNLQYWASQGLGRIFVAVYLGYYHFGQLLFYQFLHQDHSTVPNARFYATKCKGHAESLCELVYSAQRTANSEVLYTMVGHILVIASTVQIHTLLFSDSEAQISTARTRLEKNFEILSRLQGYWSTLDISFTRLRAFHQACRKSMDTSFRLDQWMLRFLYEFAEPVDDKFPEDKEWNLENIGISPQSWA
ncbi:fungal specific transcription factor [Phlyctema vagabunda]|uniref:Fungal specific transcription factor n=1 Tax=Phlyctema vagabunda TaxID=108571 RepID=A0ABR4P2P3_9HELO